MTQKFVMALPLYRQEKDLKRQGVYLSRQTMADWIIRCSEDWLEPLHDKLKTRFLTHEMLHADETVCQVLRELGKRPTAICGIIGQAGTYAIQSLFSSIRRPVRVIILNDSLQVGRGIFTLMGRYSG